MSRVEAAAKALCQAENIPWSEIDRDQRYTFTADAAAGLRAADAHDAANGVHRVSLDQHTVERAARLLCAANNLDLDYWERYPETSLIKEKFRDQARAVLAAAVKEGQ